MTKKEIPFGAFDSELMHQEIYIPEGFTATIDGDKIILTRKESKNEKIRKRLIDFFEDWHKNRSHCWGIAVTDILAWLEKKRTSNELEKQGEQKPSDEDMKEALQTEYEKGRADAITEMQVAWSEEDDEHYEACLNYFDTVKPYTVYYKDYIWLKSIKERLGGKL